MKRITFLAIIFLATASCRAQQIIDMSSDTDMDGEFENGTYYHKDVNNYLDAFTGTWKYEYGTKEYRVTLAKVEMYHELDETFNFNYYTDGLSISYQLYKNSILTYQSPTIDFANGTAHNAEEVSMVFRDFGRYGASFDLDLTLVETNDNLERETELRFNLSKWHAENLYHDQNPSESYFSVPNDILMIKVE